MNTGIVKAPAQATRRDNRRGAIIKFVRDLMLLEVNDGKAVALPSKGTESFCTLATVASITLDREFPSYTVNGTRYWVRTK